MQPVRQFSQRVLELMESLGHPEQVAMVKAQQQAAQAIYTPQPKEPKAQKPPIPETLNYETARPKFNQYILRRQDQLKAEKQNPDFKLVFDDRQKLVLDNIFRWFIGDGSIYPTNKGLWIYGQPGTFKSEIVRLCCNFLSDMYQNGETSRRFVYTDLVQLSSDYAANKVGVDKFLELSTLNRVIDEFGANTVPLTVKDYGNDINIFDSTFSIRYTKFKNSGSAHKTVVCSNMPPNEAAQILDARTVSRLTEMFTSVLMPGERKRGASWQK